MPSRESCRVLDKWDFLGARNPPSSAGGGPRRYPAKSLQSRRNRDSYAPGRNSRSPARSRRERRGRGAPSASRRPASRPIRSKRRSQRSRSWRRSRSSDADGPSTSSTTTTRLVSSRKGTPRSARAAGGLLRSTCISCCEPPCSVRSGHRSGPRSYATSCQFCQPRPYATLRHSRSCSWNQRTGSDLFPSVDPSSSTNRRNRSGSGSRASISSRRPRSKRPVRRILRQIP
jgi:hypothetical protein